jgi:type II secretory pathway predicted ATPase ExeA
MDLDYFGLRVRPFRTTPDTDAYYPATTHETALAELRRALADDEGLILLSGEPGTGKTLLAHRLLETVPPESRTAFLTHGSFRRRADLLRAILFDLGLPYREMGEQELRLELTESCLDYFRGHGRTIIVADEAHRLPVPLLDELRVLSNLAGKEGRAVQVVLIGLPALREKIDRPCLDSLRQRLNVSCQLEPLSIEESADYILHQIRRAGGMTSLLGEDVLDILSHAARGIPRLLNRAAHAAFTLARQSGAPIVDAEAAVEAVTRLGLDEGAEEPPPRPAPAAALPAPAPEPVTIPLPPAPQVTIQIARGEGPPTYVYGGTLAENLTPFAEPEPTPAPHLKAG